MIFLKQYYLLKELVKSKILCFNNYGHNCFFFPQMENYFFDLLWNIHADDVRRNFICFPEFIINNFGWLYSTSCLARIPENKCPFQEDYPNEIC